MKRWKLALSLAVLAAIAVPGLSGVWRLEPGRWVDITPGQKQRAENEIESTNHCQLLPSDPEKRVIAEFVCRKAIAMVIDGGVYHPAQQVTSKYLITLLSFAGGAFAFVFALVMVFPRYLAWLRK